MGNELVIRYNDKSRMVLKLNRLFPRTKDWLNKFFKNVLQNSPDQEEIIDRLIAYLKEVKIPGLPKELEKLDGEINAAHEHMLATQTKSIARENAEWVYRGLKSRKARWPKYCEQHNMNLEMLEGFKRG